MPNNPDKKNTVKVMYMNKSGEVEFHEKTLEEVQSEFDAIKPPTEPTDDMIDEKVDELMVDLLEDDEDDNKKVKWLQKNTTNFYDFIDFESWAKANVRHNGYGMLSSEGDSGWHDEVVETPTRRYHFHIIEENY
jgi:trans-2-enoyl-CoA reductase